MTTRSYPAKNPGEPVGVAILGHGTVGSEVLRLLTENQDDFAQRIEGPIVVRGVAVRDLNKAAAKAPRELLTTDAEALVNRDDVDIVIELIGGIDIPRPLVLAALRAGKSVVTANKALIAAHGAELSEAAREGGADLFYEAAVAAAIPLVGPLLRSLAGEKINKIIGVVNGTTNFILSAMAQTGADYGATLQEAIDLGYAEADPTADVEGFDAQSKAAILAQLAFHTRVTADEVYREGISQITAEDFQSAKEIGCTIKLLSICERLDNDRISVRVYPALISLDHPLASVSGPYNAVVIDSEAAGQLMFTGAGAGGAPTASAVLGDFVGAARNKVHGGRAPGESTYAGLTIAPFGETITRYYVSMEVTDRPGVLSEVSATFAAHNVSLKTVRQEGEGDTAMLSVLTHRSTEAELAACVEALRNLEAVAAVTSVIRREGIEA